MNPKKKNQPDTFYKLQEQELRWLKSNKLINNASYIYLALKIQNPFCDRPIKIKIKEFALYWGVPESSIYECITKLKELESISIQTKEIIISWRTHYQQETPSDIPESFRDSRNDSEIPETLLTSQNDFQDFRANSGNPESDIYKDRARAQTYSDLNQTLSNNIEGGVEFASLEEPRTPSQSSLPEQPCQPSDGTNDKAYPEDKDSAPARDNNTRYVRNQPQYPKNIDGSDRLPWDTQERGVFDAGFEKHMTRSLKGYPSYQGLLEGELQTKVRKHISGGRHDMKRRDELVIEWNAYQLSLAPKPSAAPQVSYEPLPEKKCWLPPLEEREALKKQLRAKKAGLK